MHATIFPIDLGDRTSSRERGRTGRALASALACLPGFVACIGLEDGDGAVAVLCICVNAVSLEQARQVAEDWQRNNDASARPPLQPLMTGEVIMQRGF
ncbi:MAG TPA: hypothetical protein VFI42_16580 [Thermomicrobiaceae bacterium]|nr:hypothetical protein [Thermomicrobiaceae bacterium]